MIINAIIVYLIIIFLITVIGIEIPGEALKIFLSSLVLTPLYGLFILLREQNKSNKVRFYHCNHCEYVYPVKLTYCPLCEEKGLKVKLLNYENPNKLTKLYKRLTLV